MVKEINTENYTSRAVDQLSEAARRKQDQADRAFKRWLRRETRSATAAKRLQNEADEAWRELTSHPDYDPERHSDRPESEVATELVDKAAGKAIP